MGADNLAQFHRWQNWREIMESVPVGVMARPGDRISARTSRAAKTYEHARLPGRKSQLLGRTPAPAWCFINLPMRAVSSTMLRNRGEWNAVSKS
jgi:nicotinate-nucleotide adenylyltransferase